MRQLILLLLVGICVVPVEVRAGLRLEFDYTYDSRGFFNDPVRRESLEAAGRFLNRYVDDMDAVIADGSNSWAAFINPPDSASTLYVEDIPIAQDTVKIFVGGRDIGGNLAQAVEMAPVPIGDAAWSELVRTRGQSGAGLLPPTDFSPIGGTITFHEDLTRVPWHFGLSTDGLNANEFDFITVAMHEIMHLLGIGIARSFDRYAIGPDEQQRFTGPESVAVGSPSNPNLELDPFSFHWKSGTRSTWNGRLQEALLAPGIFPGRRAFPTLLDRAALRDIGWEEAGAGDANRDRLFNSSDLLVVFQAGLYETQQFAGWSDGDWNDNALFESGDLIEALQTGTYEQPLPAVSALLTESVAPTAADQLVVSYDPLTGDVHVETGGDLLTAFEIRSASQMLQSGEVPVLTGPFDVGRDDKLFFLQLSGFDQLELPRLLPAHLDVDQLQQDLTFDGAWMSGGGPTNVRLTLVPEPAGIALGALAALAAAILGRTRR